MNGKSYSDFFDDDFEVVYEDDLPEINVNDDTDESDEQEDSDNDEQEDSDSDKRRRSDRERNRKKSSDRDDEQRRKSRSGRSHSILSPVKKTVQTGTRAAMRLIQIVCKTATLILIAVITFLLGSHFLRGLSSYGDPAAAIAEQNYAMAAYAAFALVLLLFEIISFLWALTGPRAARGNGRSFQTDTGRGMFSFILVGAGSAVAYVCASLIPESPLPMTGLKGAAEIYGSLAGTLIPLCIAGVISCILRKLFSR